MPPRATSPAARRSVSAAFAARRGAWGAGLALLAAVMLAYAPAWHGAFVWDDDFHVTRPELRSWFGLWRIWTDVMATQQFYPVLHSAFWLEHRLFGDDPTGYHFVSLGLHAANALLLVRVLARLHVPGGWMAAWIFALHPVMVESVAWISELKNTLSTGFYLCALLAWLRHRERGSGWTYGATWALFLLALGTKTVTATLPAALLVLAWWREGRLGWREHVVPLLPFFLVGIGAGSFTAFLEARLIGAEGADFALSPLERLLLAGRVPWFYLGKLVWPAELAFIYPRWTIDARELAPYAYPVATIGLLALCWRLRRRTRAPLAVVLLFGGTLVPVLGFVNVFPFQFSYVADHFQYLASLAIFGAAGAGLARVGDGLGASGRRAGAVLLVLPLAAATRGQSAIFRDSETLYRATLARNEACWLAHQNLGLLLDAGGRHPEAMMHHRRAIALKPHNAAAHLNLGISLAQQGDYAGAVPAFQAALRLQPDYAKAHRNLGAALLLSGRAAEALPHYSKAMRLATEPAAYRGYALALDATGRRGEACEQVEAALRLFPADPELLALRARWGAGQR